MANLSTDCEIIQWQRVKYSSLGEKMCGMGLSNLRANWKAVMFLYVIP